VEEKTAGLLTHPISAHAIPMKTSFELAMERLGQTSPTVQLTSQQKRAIAEIESRCKAKIAERELLLRGEMELAISKGDYEAHQQLEKQLASDRKSIQAELEEKKEQIRQQR
jgi:hypothetical protein